jgi:hypothetical protein
MVDGIQQGLDGGLNASFRLGSQENSAEVFEAILREVWEKIVSRFASPEQQSGEQLSREFADALRCLPHKNALGIGETTVATAFGYLHCLRACCEAIGIVRDASQPLVAAWLAAASKEKDWAHLAACRGPWFSEWPAVPRASKGVESRVDRLKGLGNAVVPQITEWIGKRIVEAARLG